MSTIVEPLSIRPAVTISTRSIYLEPRIRHEEISADTEKTVVDLVMKVTNNSKLISALDTSKANSEDLTNLETRITALIESNAELISVLSRGKVDDAEVIDGYLYLYGDGEAARRVF